MNRRRVIASVLRISALDLPVVGNLRCLSDNMWHLRPSDRKSRDSHNQMDAVPVIFPVNPPRSP